MTPLACRSAAEDPDVDVVDQEVDGFMVITQTCDIVRSSGDRPFVQLCPLLRVTEQVLEEVRKSRVVRYAYIPGLAERLFVADLDRVMTVEKPFLYAQTRISGGFDEDGRRLLARGLARKWSRFAFPDEFQFMCDKLLTRLKGKHDKSTPEGRALRALREIRVRAAPEWGADDMEIMFFFVREAETLEFGGIPWAGWLAKWMDLIDRREPYGHVEGQVVTLEDMTALDYVESDILDLRQLSGPRHEAWAVARDRQIGPELDGLSPY